MTFADAASWAGIGGFLVGTGALGISLQALRKAKAAVQIASVNSLRVYEGGGGGQGGLGGGGGGGGGGIGAAGGAVNFGQPYPSLCPP